MECAQIQRVSRKIFAFDQLSNFTQTNEKYKLHSSCATILKRLATDKLLHTLASSSTLLSYESR